MEDIGRISEIELLFFPGRMSEQMMRDESRKLIGNSKDKLPGLDDIHPKGLKELKHKIRRSTIIHNLSLNSSLCTRRLSIAIVSPIVFGFLKEPRGAR